MKKLTIFLSVVMMFSMMSITSLAAVDDYATVVWEELMYTTYSGETESIKVTITGVVGEQLNEYQVMTPDIPITYIDAWIEPLGEGEYGYYDETTEEYITGSYDEIIGMTKEKYTKTLNVVAVVEGATLTIEQVKKGNESSGYMGFPGSYDFLDEEKTIVSPGMGQVGSYDIGENTLPPLEEGQEMSNYIMEFPIVYDGEVMDPIGIVTVSEAKAQELLATLDDESEATEAKEEVAEEAKTQETEAKEEAAEETTSQETALEDTLNGFEVTIAEGDTVGLLSVRYYGDYTMINEIYDANKEYFEETGDKLNKGDKLILPKAPICSVPVESDTMTVYTVQAGDTLGTISEKLYGTPSKYNDIFNANKDKLTDPSLIYEGQILAIPTEK